MQISAVKNPRILILLLLLFALLGLSQMLKPVVYAGTDFEVQALGKNGIELRLLTGLYNPNFISASLESGEIVIDLNNKEAGRLDPGSRLRIPAGDTARIQGFIRLDAGRLHELSGIGNGDSFENAELIQIQKLNWSVRGKLNMTIFLSNKQTTW